MFCLVWIQLNCLSAIRSGLELYHIMCVSNILSTLEYILETPFRITQCGATASKMAIKLIINLFHEKITEHYDLRNALQGCCITALDIHVYLGFLLMNCPDSIQSIVPSTGMASRPLTL